MFDVTIDYLLDVNSYKMKKEIHDIIEKQNILSNQGKTKEREELLEEAILKYPNSWEIKSALENVYFLLAISYGLKEYEEKVIKISNEILDKCVDDKIRYSSMQSLILIYQKKGELNKAKEIVQKLPNMIISRDWL